MRVLICGVQDGASGYGSELLLSLVVQKGGLAATLFALSIVTMLAGCPDMAKGGLIVLGRHLMVMVLGIYADDAVNSLAELVFIFVADK